MAAGFTRGSRQAAFFLCVWMILALSGGCAWVIRPPLDDVLARRVVEAAARNNESLKNYKGLAQVRIEYERRKMIGRVALAAAAPDQMRVEWLSTLGQPLTSLAGDGKNITIIAYGTRKFFRFRQSRTALESMVHIPMGIEELLSILAGRPDLPEFAAARVMQANGGFQRVALKNRWHGIVAVLDIDRTSGRAISMKAYDGAGNWRYQVHWQEWRSHGAYVVPRRVEIAAPDGQRVLLTMDRFWPNVDIAPQTFVLEPLAKGVVDQMNHLLGA